MSWLATRQGIKICWRLATDVVLAGYSRLRRLRHNPVYNDMKQVTYWSDYIIRWQHEDIRGSFHYPLELKLYDCRIVI